MNHIDNNKLQVQSLGNSVQLKRQQYANTVQVPSNPPNLEQSEISLFRSLVLEAAKNGQHEQVAKLLVDTIEELRNEIKEMKK